MGKHIQMLNTIKSFLDNENYAKLPEIIDFLIFIENFKIDLSKTASEQIKFETIQIQLENTFRIRGLKIIQSIENIETMKYYNNREIDKELDYEYIISLRPKTLLKAHLNKDHLNDTDKIMLDLFLHEILTELYLTTIVDILQESVLLDPLTGLKNRLAFKEEMKNIIPLAIREKMNIGVLLFKIDRFKAVNDEHGSQFGDKFLKAYAKIIKNSIRSSDIAVRFNGGEFLVLLINISDEDKTLSLAKTFQEKLNNTYVNSPSNDKFYKTVSIGVSMFPEDSEDIFKIIDFANHALEDAKEKGRNEIVRYNDENQIELF